MVAVDASLAVLNGATLEPLEITDDATSPTGRALPTLDAVARTNLVALLAKLEAVRVLLAAPLAAVVAGTVAVSNLPATQPVSGTVALSTADFPLPAAQVTALAPLATQPVSATDLDIRPLTTTDKVTSIDAAEESGLVPAEINFATAGAHLIVTVAAGFRLRLRRFLPTMASVPDAAGDPVLTLTLGGQSLRSQALIGRFDILGGDGEDLTITSSKAGQIDGTVFYRLEAV